MKTVADWAGVLESRLNETGFFTKERDGTLFSEIIIAIQRDAIQAAAEAIPDDINDPMVRRVILSLMPSGEKL